jgi:tRNA pseudouridine55 synthase
MLPILNLKSENLWLNVDKPIGLSSARVVAIIKRVSGANKVGHGGTLDPFASGILPIALNRATKTSELLMSAKKKYLFRILWGEFRDSDDVEGKIIESSFARPTTQQIISALPFFIGKIKQVPSRFSAIKINGQRAYDLARKNIEFEIKEREVEIFSIKLIFNSSEYGEFEIECSKGTYVRSIARDICKKTKVCGYVSKLTRLAVGLFSYEKRISLDVLKLLTTYGARFCEGSKLSLQDVLDGNQAG